MTRKASLSFACCADPVDADHHLFTPERLSLFKVPFECEAVAGLGCGVRAKPILQILSREPAVAQAWLNRNGTIVAILWRERIAFTSKIPGERVRSILAEQGLAARELAGQLVANRQRPPNCQHAHASPRRRSGRHCTAWVP